MSVARDVVYFPGLVPTTFSSISDFVQQNPFAVERFRTADDFLGYSLADAYEHAEIYDWEVYEAGFMALTLALADFAVAELGVVPAVCGGQSFGAVIAAVFAGVLSYRDGLRLVRESTRVEVEYFSRLTEPLGCFFFYRMSSTTVDDVVERAQVEGHQVETSVYLDNSVHAVSGTVTGLDRLRELVIEAGGYPFYLMNRAEHCSLVHPLRRRLADEVYRNLQWCAAGIPLISDVTGEILTDPAGIRDDLLAGWTSPVHWSTIVEGIRASDADRAWVVGPRSMFGRLTGNVVPTRTVTPRSAMQAAGMRVPDSPTLLGSDRHDRTTR